MEEWKEYKLGEECQIKGGKRLPKGINLIETQNNHPYIRVRDIGKGKYLELDNSYEYVDDETQQSISRYIVDSGNIIISIVGTIGLVGIVGTTLDKANLTENCVQLKDLRGIDKNFLYYYLISQYGQSEISKGTVGAVQAKLPIKNIQNISIKAPSSSTQRKIASILSSLDDKIELNRRINANLEEQAQALFKSWFIDFEPFKDGKFVDSELGMIPEGWKVGALGDLIEIKYGKDHKKLNDGNIPVYGSGGIMRYVDTSIYEKESVLIPRKGTLNNVMYVNQSFWSVDTMFYTIMKEPNIAKFVYLFLERKDLSAMNNGSAVPSMTTNILNSLQVVLPPKDIFKRFEEVVGAIWNVRMNNLQESARLSALRDTLLPKLMSGEIEI